MNIAILEIYPDNKSINSIDMHLKNAFYIKENIKNVDILLNKKDYKESLKKNYDLIILAYSSFYAPVKEMQEVLFNNPNSKKIFWTNECQLVPNSFFMKSEYDIIAGYEKERKFKNSNNFHYLDMNSFIMQDYLIEKEKKYNIIYYGTFRKDREVYFSKYLQKEVYLSTSTKNMKKYVNAGCNPRFIKKMNWDKKNNTLSNFRYSLYIEDLYSNNNFTSLANRFYESLMAKCVQFFDINCKKTIEKSGLSFDNYFYIKSYEELIEKANNKDYIELWDKQKDWIMWALDNKKQQTEKLKQIFDLYDN